jgi:hypothetical protein
MLQADMSSNVDVVRCLRKKLTLTSSMRRHCTKYLRTGLGGKFSFQVRITMLNIIINFHKGPDKAEIAQGYTDAGFICLSIENNAYILSFAAFGKDARIPTEIEVDKE